MCGAVALFGGCSAYTSGLKPDGKYDRAHAYLYGRFRMLETNAEKTSNTMGFAIRCRDDRVYTLGFSRLDVVQVIELEPSLCQIESIIYADSGGHVLGRRMPGFRLLRNEIVSPGGVYYLGDFSAIATESTGDTHIVWMGTSTDIHMGWEITSVKDNYAQTTEEMKAQFVNLASARTEDRMSRRK